jgi:hypothetical protein
MEGAFRQIVEKMDISGADGDEQGDGGEEPAGHLNHLRRAA